jgi:NADPH:quinone reductase
MQAWTVREFSSFREALRLTELPGPRPESGSALVRVQAAGVNFADLLMIAGRYQVKPPLPFIPGFEAAGVVVEAADGAGCAPGDRVMCPLGFGAFCELLRVAPRDAFAVPDSMTDAEAAGFFLTYQTAYIALVHRARLGAGEVLLVHGAAGGAGSAALQLGKALGATVIATAGQERKVDLCRRLGADHAVDYRSRDFVPLVLEVTGGRGADVVFDPVGGDVFDRSTRCVAWEGRILPIGFAAGRIPAIAANRILLKNIAVLGMYWSTYPEHAPEVVREAHARLTELYRQGKLQPLIGGEYPLEQLPQALAAVAGRESCGKVVLHVATRSGGSAAPAPAREVP